jgi:hypothetical protein
MQEFIEKETILKRHKDRPSHAKYLQHLNLGGDLWPIFIDPTGENNVIDEYKNPYINQMHKLVLEVRFRTW